MPSSQPVSLPVEPSFKRLPLHVAIIMDGNGRWADQNNVSTISGHRMGAEVTRKIVHHAALRGVKYLTLYAFSAENWLRPQGWIDDLMGLLRYNLKNQFQDLADNGVCLKVIGDRTKLPADIVSLIEKSESETANNDRLTLIVALSYGGRDEILFATKKIADQIKANTLEVEDISIDTFSNNLYTAGIPDPDLLIRTSGEERISNFLLWQMAYTEFVFSQTLWPDFSPEDFDQALEVYQKRERRYGTTIATKK
ncbi:MAG: di-trans,poly-cis-decaprenylcistransferase [Alphaproteobacteria bacterium]|nr:di-trans,poly-cis-decaprenylcistransferase [Alphaproteobacteria bacterium]